MSAGDFKFIVFWFLTHSSTCLSLGDFYLLTQVGISESGIDDAVRNLVARG